jgi:hypothetical protein
MSPIDSQTCLCCCCCCCIYQVIHDICTKLALNYNAGGLPWPWNWLRLMLWPPSYQDLTAGKNGGDARLLVFATQE